MSTFGQSANHLALACLQCRLTKWSTWTKCCYGSQIWLQSRI